ncbi:hypothetical protein B7755_035065 [Streptomyces sp. NBS 14/10]|uniref:hypothetical protein n=1 Tax=Streptomyces sp. NBS 14/10 TaxID=1945643 RepID=UPI000B7F4785|nr:hypothetical protein [Streptomyces sp. NBS 14/10]KAK1182901.1 hypothetical protein B7755_035065 [Streptomyces sp. NBS 14/10]
MGMSSFWLVGALGEVAVAELAPLAVPAIEATAARSAAVGTWSRWERDAARGGGAVPVWREDGVYNTEDALRLSNLVDDSAFDAMDSSGKLHIMDWWDRLDTDTVQPFFESVRKDNPVAALFHGLGPERAALLPGWAGDAVFPADEVRRRLPAAEAALAVSGAERERALARIDDWPGEKEAEALLDGPLRVWRETAEAGLGLLASRIWH